MLKLFDFFGIKVEMIFMWHISEWTDTYQILFDGVSFFIKKSRKVFTPTILTINNTQFQANLHSAWHPVQLFSQYRGGGGVRHIVLILGRKSKTAFFVAYRLQGKIKSLVFISGKQKLFKKNVSMDTLHRSLK